MRVRVPYRSRRRQSAETGTKAAKDVGQNSARASAEAAESARAAQSGAGADIAGTPSLPVIHEITEHKSSHADAPDDSGRSAQAVPPHVPDRSTPVADPVEESDKSSPLPEKSLETVMVATEPAVAEPKPGMRNATVVNDQPDESVANSHVHADGTTSHPISDKDPEPKPAAAPLSADTMVLSDDTMLALDVEERAPAACVAEPAAKADTLHSGLATAVETLRHLPDSVIGKLKGFLGENRHANEDKSAKGSPSGSAKSDGAGGEKGDGKKPPGRNGSENRTPLWGAVSASKGAFIAIALFSCVINLLMLVGPLFMLQVYDRVVTSGSMPTLIALFTLTCALFAIMGLLELVRSRVLVRIGRDIDGRLSDRVFMAALRQNLAKRGNGGGALRELDTIRQFLSGPGPLTFFDAPWTPIYLIVVFMFHWVLGVAGLIGAGLLAIIAVASELRSRKPLGEAAQAFNASMDLAETGQRNVEVLQAMGMSTAYRERWQQSNQAALNWQTQAADRLGAMGAFSKALRLLLQSAMLGLGAALALQNEISAGTIVAATIIFGRSLAPVEMAINQWRSFVRARLAYHKLNELLRALPEPEERTSLPAPKGHLEIEALRVAAPMSRQMVLNGLSFKVPAGKVLCVVGPSASGKSTLARTLVGLWPPAAGAVRLDGAKIQHWNPAELGAYIGYLPQDVELFSGTLRENIARFTPGASDEDIVAAARMAHAHDLILGLPQGYETELGPFGAHLSAGQRQRVALARALYGNPAFVVLDEPNSNLDRVGDEALARAVAGMRERGQTVVIISHRVQAVRLADLMLYVDGGVQKAFGPRDEVLRQLQPSGGKQAPADGKPNSNTRRRADGRRAKPAQAG